MECLEGYVNVLGHKLFYRSFGGDKGAKGTILCLHGGPGATHDYLLPLADLGKLGYRVVFYDQLGCGRSELPKNITLFTAERYIEEVEGIRRALNLGRINLMGSSWGGLLALAYALKYQRNLRSLVTTGTVSSNPFAVAEAEKMLRRLPRRVQNRIKEFEERGDFKSAGYQRALMPFYRRHLCRLRNWPRELKYSLDHTSRPVYYSMNGPNEFTIVGNLRYFDLTEQLHRIRVPTLITGGRYDEVSPKVAKRLHAGIRNSKLVFFNRSSHLPMWEERGRYIRVLCSFLNNVNSS